MAKPRPKKTKTRRDLQSQVFFEFPGTASLGLTVTELGAPAIPSFGRLGRMKLTLWTTRVMLLLAGLLLAGSVLASGVLTYYYFTTPQVPALSALVNKQFQGATIYDRNGQVLFNLGDGATHQTATLSQIPTSLVHATIAAEDSNFYHHHGLDLAGIARATLADLQHKETVQGGSTLTQQLVKNTILSNQHSFDRKLKEAVMATKVEHHYTKNQILTAYLNQVFYGEHSWGAADAAKNYFGEPVQDLTLGQSAMLAGVVAAPTAFSPLGDNPNLATLRQQYVLTRMKALDYINRTQLASAGGEQLTYKPSNQTILAPHFVAYVRDLLSSQYSEQEMEQSGFKIYTTLDLGDQQRAQSLVTNQVTSLRGQNVSNGGLVAIDPKTGQILAMVGSSDWNNDAIGGKYSIATANRQPGSALKPFNYLTAFAKGLTPSSILHDKKTDFGHYTPRDYDGKYRGNIAIRQALQNSLNIPAVETLRFIGIPTFISTLHQMGITTLNQPLSNYGLALTLGGGEVKLLDLTSAYGVLANGGVRHDPQAILKIVDGKGKALTDNTQSSPGIQATTPQLAYTVTNVLSDNASRVMEFGSNSALYLPDRPAAAKTGTTDDFRDAWTFGYTPDLVVGTWVGNNNNAPMGAVAGALGAAPIWHDFMEQTLAGAPVHQFTQPDGVVIRSINRATGLPVSGSQGGNGSDLFIVGINPVALPDTSIKDQPAPTDPNQLQPATATQ